MFSLNHNFLDSIEELCQNGRVYTMSRKTKRKPKYINLACAFDTEATSTYIIDDEGKKEKFAFTYAYMLGINGNGVLCRDIKTFLKWLDYIREFYKLDNNKRLILYCHNLSYDFQFIRKYIKFDEVFANDLRDVIYAVSNGIEFRCSLHLTNYKLEKVGEHLIKYPVKKLVGDLDYNLIRHSKTNLTEQEKQYCLNDILVIMSHIQNEIENYGGDISKIPLTSTGYVRQLVKANCLNKENYFKYSNYISKVTINDKEEYFQMKRAFIGALTTPNCFDCGRIINYVHSIDITSSYPFSMCTEFYPCSKWYNFKPKTQKEFNIYLERYCCLFDIKFNNIESTKPFCYMISESRCFNKLNYEKINGKIIKAESISMSLTNVEFLNISRFYKWDSIEIANFKYAYKSYLPKEFIKIILDLFVKKTELKQVEGFEAEYMHSKEWLNAMYGMCVQDIIRDLILYDEKGEWKKETQLNNIDDLLKKYNNNKYRIVNYQTGLFVTSYSKYNLCSMILKYGYDFKYCDTDSIKGVNWNKHRLDVIEYNKNCERKMKQMLEFYKFDVNKYLKPKTKKGVVSIMGTFTYESSGFHLYRRFKTLGAKRYMYQYMDKSFNFTISGLGKKALLNILETSKKAKISPLELFTNDMSIKEEYTGKLTHTYIDEKQSAYITDYNGIKAKCESLSSIHLSPTDFTMKLELNLVDMIFYNLKEIY